MEGVCGYINFLDFLGKTYYKEKRLQKLFRQLLV